MMTGVERILGVGSLSLLQGIFPNQGTNPGLQSPALQVNSLPAEPPGSGRFAGEEIGYPLQYSGPENSMDCILHGVAKTPWGRKESYTTE